LNFRRRYLQSLPLIRATIKTFHLAAVVAAARNVTVPVAATLTATVPGAVRLGAGIAAVVERYQGIGRNRSTKHDAASGSPPRCSKRPGKYWQPCWQPSSSGFGPAFCRRKNPVPPAYIADPHPLLEEFRTGVGGAPLTMQQIPGPRSGTLSLRPQAASSATAAPQTRRRRTSSRVGSRVGPPSVAQTKRRPTE